MKKIYFLLAVISLLSNCVFAQTASVDAGCVPMVVSFEAPSGSNYFWDFGNGTSSILQNPDHTYTVPGAYEVELRNGQGGAVIGTIPITVWADPIIDIETNIDSGCSPVDVSFTSNIILDPALTIENLTWSFGDGNTSNELNPTHTYVSSGTFSVSLSLSTNESACDKIQIFPNIVTVEGIGNVGYSVDVSQVCEAPATVGLNNNSFTGPGVTNFWDFGNGTTSSEREPNSVTYDEAGEYEISLTVTNSLGCSETVTQLVNVAQYEIDVTIPDTVCIGTQFQLINSTAIDSFFWLLGPGAAPLTSDSISPMVSFNIAGIQTIQLLSVVSDECILESTFQFYVEEPDATFTISPDESCLDPVDLMLTANDPNLAAYTWNEIPGGSQVDFEYVCPFRDSFYINTRDSVLINLEVQSLRGCISEEKVGFISRKPYAHFVASIGEGCAPLPVVFTNLSESSNGIMNHFWDLGDGTTSSNDQIVNHVYDEPGDYYAQLIVETEEGCRDTSAGRWIQVGVPIMPIYNISDTDICLHESVDISLLNDDPRIDGWHVYTDDGRTGHCYMDSTMTHQFITTPGVYDVEFEISYNGCITATEVPEQITVNGTNAFIDYKITCETPYDILLNNTGLNADQVTWQIDDVNISTENSLMHTFPDRGEYLLTLITADGSGCPADTSNVDIFITEPVATFEVPERICDNRLYNFDATQSIDVHENCGQGYLWQFPDNRPREVDTAEVNQVISVSGLHDITLIVEDIHGCRDTTTRSTTIYGINALMIPELTSTCVPDNINFLSLSTADTTIVSTAWSFGGMGINSSVKITDTTLDSFPYSLVVVDAIGCTDEVSSIIDLYNPVSDFEISDGPSVCLGDNITFTAEDYTIQGSFLNFLWKVAGVEVGTGQVFNYVFDQLGSQEIELIYTDDESGCSRNVIKYLFVTIPPTADFISSFDSLDLICAPAQIELTNTTDYPWPFDTEWYVDGQGPFPGEEMATFAFDRGTHEVQLVVTSLRGCKDTLSKSYTLIGPSAEVSIEPSLICVGENVSFSLIDTSFVTRWEWDFGDGNILENVDPATHVFDFVPLSGSTNISLTLFSDDTGCEDIQTIPVNIVTPEAAFEINDSLEYCDGVAFFNNLSTDANEFTWSTSGEVFSNETAPQFDFGMSGSFEVTLLSSLVGKECFSEITQEITLDFIPPLVELPNVFTPNGDGNNDNFNIVVTDPQFEEFVNIITFKVYDRWGELVYDNDNPSDGWDGNFDNTEAPTEMYAYYIEYEIVDCKNESRKGNVTIIR